VYFELTHVLRNGNENETNDENMEKLSVRVQHRPARDFSPISTSIICPRGNSVRYEIKVRDSSATVLPRTFVSNNPICRGPDNLSAQRPIDTQISKDLTAFAPLNFGQCIVNYEKQKKNKKLQKRIRILCIHSLPYIYIYRGCI